MNSIVPQNVTLTVSIVLYNSPVELLLSTLDSLRESAAVAVKNRQLATTTVYILDNTTEAFTRKQVREALKNWSSDGLLRLCYRETGENRGFGAGHNQVLAELESDYHLILNPDAELSKSTLDVGLGCMLEDDGIVLLSPEVSGDDGRQEFLCKRYPSVLVLLLRAFAPRLVRRLFRSRLHRYEMRDACRGEEAAEVMLVSGCFMLVRTRALQAVSGFDERFFLYFEDFDLSLRLGGSGRKVYNPEMKIVHHGGYAARKGMHHVGLFVRSGIQFFKSHGWRWV